MPSVASFLFIFVGDCPAVLCSGRTISRVSALVFPHPHQHLALSLFFSHPDRYTAIPHCGFSLHFPNSLVVKDHASVFMWQHGSGLAGHKSPGWLMVGRRNEDGRATWPLGSRHAAGRLGDRARSGRGGARGAFGGLFSERAQLHIPCPVIPASPRPAQVPGAGEQTLCTTRWEKPYSQVSKGLDTDRDRDLEAVLQLS